MNFSLPERFDDDSVLNAIMQFQNLEDVSDLVFDFRRVGYVFPFPTLALFVAILELIEKRKAKALRTSATGTETGYGALSYLRHLGFFFAGWDYLSVMLPTKLKVEHATYLLRLLPDKIWNARPRAHHFKMK